MQGDNLAQAQALFVDAARGLQTAPTRIVPPVTWTKSLTLDGRILQTLLHSNRKAHSNHLACVFFVSRVFLGSQAIC